MRGRAAESAADMLKKVRVKIVTDRTELGGSIFAGDALTPAPVVPTREEMTVEGRYHDDGMRVSISYEESEISGMEGSRVTLSFPKSGPQTVTMLRTGSVKTSLLFEEGCQHECVYQTQLMSFDVCLRTDKVQNAIETMGTLDLDYIVELKGAQAERTKMRILILPAYDKPRGL